MHAESGADGGCAVAGLQPGQHRFGQDFAHVGGFGEERLQEFLALASAQSGLRLEPQMDDVVGAGDDRRGWDDTGVGELKRTRGPTVGVGDRGDRHRPTDGNTNIWHAPLQFLGDFGGVRAVTNNQSGAGVCAQEQA